MPSAGGMTIMLAGMAASRMAGGAVGGAVGGAIKGGFNAAKFVATLPKKILDAAVFGPVKIVKMLTGIMGKGFGLVGISTSLSSLLRQSQIFTGSIGALLQMIGAFIDIMLAPFMPAFGRLIGKMGTWVPKIQEFSTKFYEWVTGSAWPFLKELPKKIIEHFGGSWDVLMSWWNNQTFQEWISNPTGMLKQTWDSIQPHLVGAVRQIFTTLVDDAMNIYNYLKDTIWPAITGFAAAATEGLSDWWTKDGEEIWKSAKDKISTWWTETASPAIGTAIGTVSGILSGWWDAIPWKTLYQKHLEPVLDNFFTSIGIPDWKDHLDNIKKWIGEVKDKVVAWWDSRDWDKTFTTWEGWFEKIKDKVIKVADAFIAWEATVDWELTIETWGKWIEDARNILEGAFGAAKTVGKGIGWVGEKLGWTDKDEPESAMAQAKESPALATTRVTDRWRGEGSNKRFMLTGAERDMTSPEIAGARIDVLAKEIGDRVQQQEVTDAWRRTKPGVLDDVHRGIVQAGIGTADYSAGGTGTAQIPHDDLMSGYGVIKDAITDGLGNLGKFLLNPESAYQGGQTLFAAPGASGVNVNSMTVRAMDSRNEHQSQYGSGEPFYFPQ